MIPLTAENVITLSRSNELRHDGDPIKFSIDDNWVRIGCKRISRQACDFIAQKVREYEKPKSYTFWCRTKDTGPKFQLEIVARNDEEATEKFYKEIEGTNLGYMEFLRQ